MNATPPGGNTQMAERPPSRAEVEAIVDARMKVLGLADDAAAEDLRTMRVAARNFVKVRGWVFWIGACSLVWLALQGVGDFLPLQWGQQQQPQQEQTRPSPHPLP